MTLAASISLGLLILRLVVGLTIAAHGAQKAFGWFGGAGFTKMANGFNSQGLRPGWLWISLAILGELGGGLSLVFGFLTPLGAAGVVGAMLMAIFKSHWRNGFWNSKRGIEFPLQILGGAVALGFTGPGGYALDAALGLSLPLWLFPVLALAAIISVAAGLAIGSRAAHATSSAPSTTPAR